MVFTGKARLTSIPGNYDLTIVQGATLDLLLTYKDDAGVVINLTGYTARLKIRTAVAGSELVSLTEADGLVLGGAAGTIRIQRSAAQTAAYTWSRAVYDLELISGAVVTRLVEGNVLVRPEITV